MAKKTVKKTVEEMRADLERQIEALESFEKLDEEIKSLAGKYRDYYNDEVTRQVEDGLEEEQAKNWSDELLYKLKNDADSWKTYTEQELTEKGIAITDDRVVKYYRTKYKAVPIPDDEMSTWSKNRAIAYKKLADFFEALDVMEVFKD